MQRNAPSPSEAGRGDVIGIAGKPIADELGIDFCTARLGVFEFFQHHATRALSHDETVAVLVIGTRGALGSVVEIGRERAQRGKTRERNAVDRRFRSTRHHHFGIAQRDHPRRIADGMRAGRTGGDHGVVGALEAELDGDEAGSKIDDASRHEERRDPARALFAQRDRRVGDALDAADAGADQNAGPGLILVALRFPGCVVERLARRAHAENDELVDLALIFRLHPLIGIIGAVGAIAARNAAGDLAGNIGNVERVDPLCAALTLEQTFPGMLGAAPERRQHSHAGDHDTSHSRAPTGKSDAPTPAPPDIALNVDKLRIPIAVAARLLSSSRSFPET